MITEKEIHILQKIIKIYAYNKKLYDMLSKKDGLEKSSIFKSISLMNSMYEQMFQDYQLEVVIPEIGETYDPYKHFPKDVLQESKGKDPDDLKVIDVIRPGLRTYGGDIIIKAEVRI